MSLRPVPGWQFVLTDLSLILFLTTATALSRSDGVRTTALEPETSTPVASAVYVAQDNAPDFADWLSGRNGDPREQLTIEATYDPSAQADIAARAVRMTRDAARNGIPARLVLTPANESRIVARFAFDAAQGEALARDLQDGGESDAR